MVVTVKYLLVGVTIGSVITGVSFLCRQIIIYRSRWRDTYARFCAEATTQVTQFIIR